MNKVKELLIKVLDEGETTYGKSIILSFPDFIIFPSKFF